MISDAQAHAVTAVANATGKAIDLVGGAGAWLDRTVGSIPPNLFRVAGGDWLGEVAERNLARMRAKTAHILDGISRERISEPSPSVVLPLLTAAMDESREELQDLWAALLANALVDGGRRVRRDYFDAVRQMEPLDATVLDVVARRPNEGTGDSERLRMDMVFIDQERQRLGASHDDFAIATGKLVKLDCLTPPGPTVRPHSLTPFGRGLLGACKPP